MNRKISKRSMGCLPYGMLPRISWTVAVLFAAVVATILINRNMYVVIDNLGSDRRFINHVGINYDSGKIMGVRLVHSDLPTKTSDSLATITVSSRGQDLDKTKELHRIKVSYLVSAIGKLGFGEDAIVTVDEETDSIEDTARYGKIANNLNKYGSVSEHSIALFMEKNHVTKPYTKTGLEFMAPTYGGYSVKTKITLKTKNPDSAEQLSYKLSKIIDEDKKAPLVLEDISIRVKHKNCRTIDDMNSLERVAKKISDYHMDIAVEPTGDSVEIYNLNRAGRYTKSGLTKKILSGKSKKRLRLVVYERDDYLNTCCKFESDSYERGYGSGTCLALCNCIRLHDKDFNFSSGKYGRSFGYCFDYGSYSLYFY